MTRKRVVFLVSGLLVVCIGLGVWLLISLTRSGESINHPTGPQVPTASTTPSLSATNAEQLEQALNSSSRHEQSLALAPMLRDGFLGQQQLLLPAGTTIMVQPNSFQAGGAHGAIVGATSNNHRQYRLWLSKIDGQWYVMRIEAKN